MKKPDRVSRPLKPRLLFVTRFLTALVVFYALVAINPVNDRVIVPFSTVLARATAFVLSSVESGVGAEGTVIRSPRFALDVENGCNGVEAAILLAAAILAFPATLRSRLIGLMVAGVAIQLLNGIRLLSLFWLGEYHRTVFDFFHVAIWQSLIILAAISLFMIWSLKLAERPLARSS
jgi:exosortase H (IPTLxxWG-CTERM-specific)